MRRTLASRAWVATSVHGVCESAYAEIGRVVLGIDPQGFVLAG